MYGQGWGGTEVHDEIILRGSQKILSGFFLHRVAFLAEQRLLINLNYCFACLEYIYFGGLGLRGYFNFIWMINMYNLWSCFKIEMICTLMCQVSIIFNPQKLINPPNIYCMSSMYRHGTRLNVMRIYNLVWEIAKKKIITIQRAEYDGGAIRQHCGSTV